jgi:prepilin-type N-terminal cleavage/methylation domain-containing protein
MTKHTKKESGFSLIEMIVAAAIFIVLGGVAVSSVIQFLGGYRQVLADQIAQEELRNVSEYMSRELRMAICRLAEDCNVFQLRKVAMGYNEVDPVKFPTLEFLNYKGQLVRYALVRDGGVNAIARICSDAGQDCEMGGLPMLRTMTSKNISILGLSFIINGDKVIEVSSTADQRQPAITALITGVVQYQGKQKIIIMQTTVSPRKLQS